MKAIRGFVAAFVAAVALFCLTGCVEKFEDREKTTVLIYVAGNNNLSYYAIDCLNQLKQGFIPSDSLNADNLLIYYHVPGESPTLFKMVRTKDGIIRQNVLCRYPEDQLSATAETFNRVILDAQALCPAEHNALILWSHATGFLPQGYYDDMYYGRYDSAPASSSPRFANQKKTFGKDYDSPGEIELVDLAKAIPFKFDYIFSDSCLMGCVEVAYELRDKCDYLVLSPTEVMAQGFPYYMMMDELFNNHDREAAATAIASEYYDYYCKHSGGCTVVALRSSALDALAEAAATVISANRDKLPLINKRAIQVYDRCEAHWMFDMDQIMSAIGSSGDYYRFQTALNNAIVYKAATPEFLEIKIKHYGGLGMYLPISDAPKLNSHYKMLAWNLAVQLVQ